MKIVILLLSLTVQACHKQDKEEKPKIDVSKGVRVKRGPDGQIITLPDSSRMDSL